MIDHKAINKVLTPLDIQGFVSTPGFRYMKSWLKDELTNLTEKITQLKDNSAFLTAGKIDSVLNLLAMLEAFDDLAAGRIDLTEPQKSGIDNYKSEKPEELTKPIKLED
jgi:hypothetical protein